MKRSKRVYAEDVINYIKEEKKLKDKFEKEKAALQEKYQVKHAGEDIGPEFICDENCEFKVVFVALAKGKNVNELLPSIEKS